ncbi:serine hydrolase [Stenotrophomonas sp. WZN-1]|uniref:serine hydrolase domain-containing protein n=1 Tax=Stenotrophomonas sp. WZN-1 TaxID=2005046 RepID=UPI000B432A7C|nr:serine hydrolase domain-containing protein [Stenotrophomonas sp. WZN-1]ARZ76525.1 serine hydrolase [Stenotrophomonas sp. WZN-1]
MLIGALPFAAASASQAPANEQARRLIRQIMQELRIPGLQITVVKDGQIVLSEAYGLANVENGVRASRDTRFPLNSATKAFTGVAIAQLAEQGRLDLDASASRYLDDLPAAWREVRVRQLLAHTSGLPDILDANGLLGGGSEAQAWTAVTARPLEAAPGQRFAYNQTNYVLLARIIAQQSGMSYERFLATGQFSSARMARTTFGDSYDLVPDVATMYSLAPRATDAADAPSRLSHWFYDIPPLLWAGGGILTTADDTAHWLVALTEGRLLGDAARARMWSAERLPDGRAGPWAGGWPVLRASPDLQVAGIGGARSAFVVYPERGVAVVVLTNLVGANPQQFIPRIADCYARDSSTPRHERVALARQQRAAIAGP